MSVRVGDLGWARKGGGRLSRNDRLRLIGQAMRAQLDRAFRRGAREPFAIDVDALRVPDSPACAAAADLLADSSAPWLANHCLRTYLWAAIVGMGERRAFDEETLFVASALHDLGLTNAVLRFPTASAECFAVAGASAAVAFLAERGHAEAGRSRVAEAISLHMNPRVTPAQGVEAYLLHEGAALDVVGARLGDVSEGARVQVLRRHPRMDMKVRIVEAMKEQSRARPASRAAFLCRHGFIAMIRRAPFES